MGHESKDAEQGKQAAPGEKQAVTKEPGRMVPTIQVTLKARYQKHNYHNKNKLHQRMETEEYDRIFVGSKKKNNYKNGSIIIPNFLTPYP